MKTDLNCGVFAKVFTSNQVENMISLFKRARASSTLGNDYHGIGPDHLGYLFVKKMLLDPINQLVGVESKLIFAFYLECVTPLYIHRDIKPIPAANGKPFLSFVIPYSVDEDVSKCNYARTLIFDQYGYENNDSLLDIDNNVENLHQVHLQHNKLSWCKKFSLKQDIQWNTGDLIWWDSRLAHSSNDFKAIGCNSKQGIVMHTYV